MQAYLRVTSGPDAGRTFDLIEGIPMVIGRGEKSNTRLTDGTVSRLHCELKWENHTFTLVDLDSVGGTFVGGQKIQEHALRHDEEFQIGGTRLKLHTTGIPDAQTVMAAQKPAREIAPDEAVLTGKPPFEGKNLVETIARIRQADPVPPKKYQLSIADQFQDAVMVMLAERPEKRHQTPAGAARALERVAKFQGVAV